MFQTITDRFVKLKRKLRGKGRLSRVEIERYVKEVERILIEADVNLKVVKEFSEELRKNLKIEVINASISPGDQVIKVVYKQLVNLLGGEPVSLRFNSKPSIVMLVGLQGAGKTTTAVKLGLKFKSMNPLLVACDIKRPAAEEQLFSLAKKHGLSFHGIDKDVESTFEKAIKQADRDGNRLIILDTAGRLHIDEEMMEELSILARRKPEHIIFVADGMTGQDAVNQAQGFMKFLNITGAILTKMDGDARGGAALSLRKITGKPIFFIGVGEQPSALEEFIPSSIAQRIMGMGDVAALVKRVENASKEIDREKVLKKLKKGRLDFNDLLEQLKALKNMGGFQRLMEALPVNFKKSIGFMEEDYFKKAEAIILSMTPEERSNPHILNASRKRRIARGSGTTVTDINRLIKELETLNNLRKMKGRGLPLGFKI